jgi:hypothetical protein
MVAVRSNDELGIAAAFNNMADNLAQVSQRTRAS